jgi:hypothetical protein
LVPDISWRIGTVNDPAFAFEQNSAPVAGPKSLSNPSDTAPAYVIEQRRRLCIQQPLPDGATRHLAPVGQQISEVLIAPEDEPATIEQTSAKHD